VLLRLRSVLDTIVREHRKERVLIVSHQVIVNCFRYLLERLDEQAILAIDRSADVPNCSVTSYEFDAARGKNGKLVARLVNFVAPLREAGAPDGRLWRHDGGNVGLATSGSGDVLSRLIAGFAARGATIEQASSWGVALHARAGNALAARVGMLWLSGARNRRRSADYHASAGAQTSAVVGKRALRSDGAPDTSEASPLYVLVRTKLTSGRKSKSSIVANVNQTGGACHEMLEALFHQQQPGRP
jgi:Histidine phosphatase superfamily (branch 1)/Carbohydrate kinase